METFLPLNTELVNKVHLSSLQEDEDDGWQSSDYSKFLQLQKLFIDTFWYVSVHIRLKTYNINKSTSKKTVQCTLHTAGQR